LKADATTPEVRHNNKRQDAFNLSTRMLLSKTFFSSRHSKAQRDNVNVHSSDRSKTGSIFHLNDMDKTRLLAASLKNTIDYHDDMEAFIRNASLDAQKEMTLESHLFKAIDDFAKGEDTYLQLCNLPIDPAVPPTPADGKSKLVKETNVHEHLQVMIGTMLGAKYAVYPWKEQYTHPLFHVGYAIPSSSADLGAISNSKNLPYHMDLEGLRNVKAAPEYLFLGCLREGNDPYQFTKILDNVDILAQIPEEVKEDMKEDRFILPNKTKSFIWYEIPQPILYEDVTIAPTLISMVDGPLAVLPADPDDSKAWRAIAWLHAAIERAEAKGLVHKMHFQAGDLLIIRNQAVLHSRESSQPPKFDGTDHILVRSFWMSCDTVAKMKGNSMLWTSSVDYDNAGSSSSSTGNDGHDQEEFELI
jgi:hypothetical protein